ncbi:MAG: T9SS type A sorting domain-containing protein [Bacteroidales bacterium]|nr:T9SS type A sorting domain-containing protein [Bacteroidales bacterium]
MKLISIDTTGEVLWESIVIENDTSYNYSTFGLLQLPDSSFFMSGSYHYSDYTYKPFMARVSSSGELLYTRVHELPWPEGSAIVYGICSDGRGNVMNCAEFRPTLSVNQGIWMIKTNADGDTLWTKTIANEGTAYWPFSVALCRDGGYAVAGWYSTELTPTTAEWGAFIMRTDSLANPLWARTYASDKNGCFYEIIEASDHGLAATGVASPSPGHQAFYLVKTDTAGLITSTWQPGAVADRLTVSPNPVADVCHVTLPQGCRQLTLLTLQGQTLSTFNTTGKSTLELSTNWLPAGLYLLRAETSTMRTTEKIVKYAR